MGVGWGRVRTLSLNNTPTSQMMFKVTAVLRIIVSWREHTYHFAFCVQLKSASPALNTGVSPCVTGPCRCTLLSHPGQFHIHPFHSSSYADNVYIIVQFLSQNLKAPWVPLFNWSTTELSILHSTHLPPTAAACSCIFYTAFWHYQSTKDHFSSPFTQELSSCF